MDVVVPDHGAQPAEPINGTATNGARVLALGARMPNVVVFDGMLAAPQEDPALRSVVNQIVGNADAGALADAAAVAESEPQGDSLRISLDQPDVMDVVVVDADLGWRQADHVTRGDENSVGTHVMNVIADDTILSASFDHHATSVHVAYVTDRVPGDEAVCAVLERDRRAVAAFHGEAPDSDVGTVFQLDELR